MTFVSDIIIHLWLFVAKTHDFGFDRQKQPFRGVLMNVLHILKTRTLLVAASG